MKVKDAIATWWIRNAEIRHGHVPAIGDVIVPDAQPSSTVEKTASTTSEKSAVETTQPATEGSSLLSKAVPAVLGAVLGVGSGMAAVPYVLDWMNPTPAVEQSTPQPVEQTGSLYQYLEDRGDHLP